MTTLENSYCVPETKEECASLGLPEGCVGDVAIWDFIVDDIVAYGIEDVEEDSVKITVNQFLDVTNNKIAPWRLKEIGFKASGGGFKIHIQGFYLIVLASDNPMAYIEVSDRDDIDFHITTFSDLLTQIRFLTPPKK